MKNRTESDVNFDPLVSKFKRKVYGGLKGDIRLAVLKRDLSECLGPGFLDSSGPPLNILDAGGGYGPFSFVLARNGHHVVLCDISKKMLDHAAGRIRTLGLDGQVCLIHSSIQDLGNLHHQQYDLVLCHAVLEWTANPLQLLEHTRHYLKPGGILSLIFYNIHGTVFKNLLRANYRKVLEKDFSGWPGSLTPLHPLAPDQVKEWVGQLGFTILEHSGMRVFHDYILNMEDQTKTPETVIELELEYSRQMPFRDLGRYQHLLVKLPK